MNKCSSAGERPEKGGGTVDGESGQGPGAKEGDPQYDRQFRGLQGPLKTLPAAEKGKRFHFACS